MTTRAVKSGSIERLTTQLVAQIKSPAAAHAPFIVENRVPQTHTRHVVVIWDAWADLDPAERSRLIMDAYTNAGVLSSDTVSVAMGITEQEALHLGYLNYSVVAHHKKTDPVTLSQLRKALEQVGGVHVRRGTHFEVRFPTRELAEQAYRQLQEAMPGPWWGIAHEMAA